MNVYVANAALYCEHCVRRWNQSHPHMEFDGPHANGGGEADSPQYCDDCREFLENPLTTDGRRELVARFAAAITKAVETGVWSIGMAVEADYCLDIGERFLRDVSDLAPEVRS